MLPVANTEQNLNLVRLVYRFAWEFLSCEVRFYFGLGFVLPGSVRGIPEIFQQGRLSADDALF